MSTKRQTKAGGEKISVITAKERELRHGSADLPLPKSTVGIEEIAKKVSSLMALLSQGQQDPAAAEEATAGLARQLHCERRERDAAFGTDMFGEPSWDMLLYLYGHGEEPELLSLEALCETSAVAPTTSLRYLNAMLDKGWIVRSAPSHTEGTGTVALSPETRDRMRGLLERILEGRRDPDRAGEAHDRHEPPLR